MRRIGLFVVAVSLCHLANAQRVGDTYDRGAQVRIGQYSTQSSIPGHAESDPLAVFVQINYPRQGVTTIGDALNYTLLRTGWSLDSMQLRPEAVTFLDLPLPESQRSIGTFRVRDVLQILVGDTWQWKENPVRRQLWIALSEPAGLTQAQALPRLEAWRVDVTPAASADASHQPEGEPQ